MEVVGKTLDEMLKAKMVIGPIVGGMNYIATTYINDELQEVSFEGCNVRRRFDKRVSLVERAVELADWKIAAVLQAQICLDMCEKFGLHGGCFKFENAEVKN